MERALILVAVERRKLEDHEVFFQTNVQRDFAQTRQTSWRSDFVYRPLGVEHSRIL